jgi:Tfp pilus assembly protein PilN
VQRNYLLALSRAEPENAPGAILSAALRAALATLDRRAETIRQQAEEIARLKAALDRIARHEGGRFKMDADELMRRVPSPQLIAFNALRGFVTPERED